MWGAKDCTSSSVMSSGQEGWGHLASMQVSGLSSMAVRKFVQQSGQNGCWQGICSISLVG